MQNIDLNNKKFYSGFVKNKAFTLAEILITLGIIGIVASLTVPTIIQKQKEAETISALKKSYSTLSNAYIRAMQENGEIKYWGALVDDGANSKLLLDKLAVYMNVQKNCGNSVGCFAPVEHKTLNGGSDNYKSLNSTTACSKLILSDGTSVMLDVLSNLLEAFVVVDVNGFKSPNQFGIDTFVFKLSTNTVLAEGVSRGNKSYSFPAACDKDSAVSQNNGRACTAWVLFNGNMDYLHCGGLSWSGKTQCD